MSISLLCWLFVFILQSGLLGRSMFNLICLSDLEQDFINPYDLSNKLNRFVILEYSAQAVMTVVLTACGKWFAAALHIGILAYMIKLYASKQVYIDATEAFRELKPQKLRRGIIFGLYCFSFVLVTYRIIETVFHDVLSPEGRKTAKKLFKEAAASLHGY